MFIVMAIYCAVLLSKFIGKNIYYCHRLRQARKDFIRYLINQ